MGNRGWSGAGMWTVGGGAARTHYLANFCDDFSATAAATGIQAGRPLLLALGRLHADKGFDTLIRAMARVPQAVLAIAGAGPEFSSLQALARREGVAGRGRVLGVRARGGGAVAGAGSVLGSSGRGA